MNVSLPPVANHDSPFKNDRFMISLAAADVTYKGNIHKILEKELSNIVFNIEMVEGDLFEIAIRVQDEFILVTSHDVMLSSLHREKDGHFSLIY